MRYKPWGGKRYPGGESTLPTTFRFTGQRQEVALSAVNGLYDYGARWYDPALGRFIQADTLVPDPYNPLDWDRFSYARNNPVRYTDPTGHLVCSDKHVAGGDCSDEGVGLWRFGITLTGNWSNEHKSEAKKAALAVGAKMTGELGGTAWDAFRKVYGKVEIFWGNGEGHSLSDECAAITSGGCTSSAHLINFMITWSNRTSAVYNMVHEFGHAFNNLLWFDNSNTGRRDRLPEAYMVETGGLERSAGGYAGPYGTWQQSQKDTPSENFADMFLGWTYGEWEESSYGIYRGDFMSRWMPRFIWASLK
jgi:RHS repeat-associated protein